VLDDLLLLTLILIEAEKLEAIAEWVDIFHKIHCFHGLLHLKNHSETHLIV
jgi:hypothetical protein